VLGEQDFVEKLKGMKIKGSANDYPSYRMIQSIDAEALIKQAAEYFRLGEAELTGKRRRHRQERALVMELLHRYGGLKQRRIAERFGGLDEGLVSRDRRATREKIETEPKIRKWFHGLTRLSTSVKIRA
jgi:chromosomal replication initiation ATPase DnaA